MHIRLLFLPWTLVALCFSVTLASAQMRNTPTDSFGDRKFNDILLEYTEPEWKTPGWFHHAEKKNPKAQFEHAKGLEEKGKLSSACSAYDALVREWPADGLAPSAQLAVARLFEERDKKEQAFREYQYAVLMYPNAISYEEVVQKQMALLRDMESELGTGFLGMGQTMDADDIARLYRIVSMNAPAGNLASECLFRMGELYAGEHCKKYDLALEPYDSVVSRYPESDWAPMAAFHAARARVLLSRKYPRDGKRSRAALTSVDSALAGSFKRLPNPADAQKELLAWREEVYARVSHEAFQQAEFYDTIRHKPQAAIVAYKRFLELYPAGPDAERARARLEKLEAASAPTPASTPNP